jgi:hypothetical protein
MEVKEYQARVCHNCVKPFIVEEVSFRRVCPVCARIGHENTSSKKKCSKCRSQVWYRRIVRKISSWFKYMVEGVKNRSRLVKKKSKTLTIRLKTVSKRSKRK